jgi:hypothetical protein
MKITKSELAEMFYSAYNCKFVLSENLKSEFSEFGIWTEDHVSKYNKMVQDNPDPYRTEDDIKPYLKKELKKKLELEPSEVIFEYTLNNFDKVFRSFKLKDGHFSNFKKQDFEESEINNVFNLTFDSIDDEEIKESDLIIFNFGNNSSEFARCRDGYIYNEKGEMLNIGKPSFQGVKVIILQEFKLICLSIYFDYFNKSISNAFLKKHINSISTNDNHISIYFKGYENSMSFYLNSSKEAVDLRNKLFKSII